MADTSDAAVGSISHILKTAFKDIFDEKAKQDEAIRLATEHAAKKEAQRLRLEARAISADGAPEGVAEVEGDEENKDQESAQALTTEASPSKLGNILPHLRQDLEQRQEALDADVRAKLDTANDLKRYLLDERRRAHEAEEQEEENLKKQGIMIGQHIPPLPTRLAVSAERLSAYGDFSANLQVAREMVESNKVNTLRRTGNLPISDLAEQKKADRAAKMKSGADAHKPHYMQDNSAMAIRNSRQVERYAAVREARLLDERSKYEETGGIRPRYEPQYGKPPVALTGNEKKANTTILKRMNHKLNYLRNPRNVYGSIDQVLTINQNEYTKNNRELTRLAGTSGPGYDNDGNPLGDEAAAAATKAKKAESLKITEDDLAQAAKNMLALAGKVKRVADRPSSPDAYESEKASPKDRRAHDAAANDRDDEASAGSSTFDGGFGFAKAEAVKKIVVPLFRADPPELLFESFEVGQGVTLPITFTNISMASRMVRIIPPAAPQFSLAPIKYPVNSKSGMCAPGMSVSTSVTFYAENLADASDVLVVETESGSYTVPIVARRDSPKLSIPPTLNVGTCMVGDCLRVQVVCQNTGGRGRFRVVRAEDFDVATGRIVNGSTFGGDTNPNNKAHPDDEPDWAGLGCLRMAPFTLYPVHFELQKMESMHIIIEFVPLELCGSQPFSHKFYILSDNLQVFEYTLLGRSRQLDCYISEINSRPFNQRDTQIRREIFFEAANIGIEQTQQIVVTNDSGLPVEYEWVWLDPADNKGRSIVDGRDLTAAGRAKLRAAERLLLEAQQNAATMRGSPLGTPLPASNKPAYVEDELDGGDAEGRGDEVVIAGYRVSPLDDELPAREKGKAANHARSAPSTAPNTAATVGFSPASTADGRTKEQKRAGALRPMSGTPSEGREQNAVVEKSFQLSPARGMLGVDGAETFTITFVPSVVPLATMQAVLMLKNVPEAALQSDHQRSLLSRLQHEGHGRFVRLLSWIDQLSETANMPAPAEGESDGKVATKLVSLRTLLDVVYRHASGCVLPSDVFLVEQGVRMFLAHVYLWRKRQMEPDEDEVAADSIQGEDGGDAVGAHDEDSPTPLFLWDGEAASTTAPVVMDPVSLKYSAIDLGDMYRLYSEEAEKARIDALGTDYDAEAEARAKEEAEELAAKNPQPPKALATPGEPLVFSLELLRALHSQGSSESTYDELGVHVRQGDFVLAEEMLLSRVWLEPEQAVALLGPFVSEVLDLQVKHEAVDYLRHKALQTISCLTINAAGEGKPQVVRIMPPLLSIGGPLPIEQTWKGQIRLVNTSTAMAEMEFRPDLMDFVCLNTDGRRKEEDTIADAIISSLLLPGPPRAGEEHGGLSMLQSIAEEPSQIGGHALGRAGVRSHPSLAVGEDGLAAQASVVSRGGAGELAASGSQATVSGPSQTSVITETDLSKIQIEFDPPRILLMPEADATVDVYATMFCLGQYEISIPVHSTSTASASATKGQSDLSGAQVDRVHLSLRTCGPRLQFLDPEVDLGLVGVGGTTSCTFSFVNEGVSTASFELLPLTEAHMEAISHEKLHSLGPDGKPRLATPLVMGAAPGKSEHSINFESEGSVGVESSRAGLSTPSPSGVLQEGRQAVVTVEPTRGTAAPGEKITVTINCKGGVDPQRVRGCIRARIGSAMREVDPMPDQFLGFRCEVQAPKTVLYPMSIDLGRVYVGVPVYFYIHTENICNLPTAYALERPGGEDGAFRLIFDKPSGPLGPKEKVSIRCTFIALQAGVIDGELVANKIRGVPDPLGFVLRGEVLAPLVDMFPLDGSVAVPVAKRAKGSDLAVSRRNTSESSQAGHNGPYAHLPYMPAPLARPTDSRFPVDSAIPLPAPLPVKTLLFSSAAAVAGKDAVAEGDEDVALYERCFQQFAIRNLSAVPVSFDLRVVTFTVAGEVSSAQLSGATPGQESAAKSATAGAVSTKTKTNAGSLLKPAGPLLQPHEDGANKFHSVGGQRYAEASVQRRENRLFLTSGLGASYLVSTDAFQLQRLTQPLPGDVALPDAQQNERTGYLDPWGVALVTLRTFNDMPGTYDDTLLVTFRDLLNLQWTQELRVPLKMTVSGCPLSIDSSTYGMTKEKLTVYKSLSAEDAPPAPPAAVARKARDMLSFGVNPFHCESVTRELYVQNNGSMPGRVVWQVRSALQDKTNGAAKLTLRVGSEPGENDEDIAKEEEEQEEDKEDVGEESKDASVRQPNGAEQQALKEVLHAKSELEFWSDADKEAPFKIEPMEAVIAPYKKQKFKVTMFRTSGNAASATGEDGDSVNSESAGGDGANKEPATELAQLIGLVKFDKSDSATGEASAAQEPSASDQQYRLQLLLQGRLVHPTITIDKKTYTVTSSETVVPLEHGGIKFKSEANGIFGTRDKRGRRGASGPSSEQDCSRIVTLVNPLETTLVCCISTEGQFSLKLAADDSAVKAGGDKGGGAKDKVSMSQTHGAAGSNIRTAVGADSLGRTITLLPRASASFVLAFQPSRGLRDTVTAPKQATQATGTNQEEGQLIVAFSTGQRLFLPLLGSVATPFLVGSSPQLFFGTCKVGAATEGTLLLGNPTTVLARWVVKHLPTPNDQRNQRKKENDKLKIKVPGYEYPPPETDDPFVFLITPSAGSVEGPTVSVAAATAAPPKDLNRAPAESAVVPQRLSEASWATSTLTMRDTIAQRHEKQGAFEADARFPVPLQVQFRPKDNKVYSSRFRITCEYGNSFDVLLSGNGTYEEHEHMPLCPAP